MRRATSRVQKNSDSNGYSHFTSKKIFVGGLSSSLTEAEFKNYFEAFGRITDVVVMHDSATRRPRGFGFITFESEESVEHVMQNNFYELNGKLVEVKRAVPKEANNNNKNDYNTRMGGGRGSSFPQHGHNLHYASPPGYEIFPGYWPPYSGYGGIENYYYGMFSGGYFMGENGGIDYARTYFHYPWNGPGTFASGIIYHPPYSNGRVGMLGMVADPSNGFAGPRTSSSLQVDAALTRLSRIDPSLGVANGSSSPPYTALNNSDGVKLGTACNDEASLSSGEISGPDSLKDDGVASLHLKEDGSESCSHLKVNCAAASSDSKDDDTACSSDSCNGAAPSDTKDDGVTSSSCSYDDDTTCNLNSSNLKCNGAASDSSCSTENKNYNDEQLKPSPDCDSS